MEDELKLDSLTFESEPHVGENVVAILDDYLNRTAFAVLVLTGEDETHEGKLRARQNVVHEAGLFQGRLGFKRVALVIQRGVEEFSNVAGLQHIRFDGDNIQQAFLELQRALKREGLIR